MTGYHLSQNNALKSVLINSFEFFVIYNTVFHNTAVLAGLLNLGAVFADDESKAITVENLAHVRNAIGSSPERILPNTADLRRSSHLALSVDLASLAIGESPARGGHQGTRQRSEEPRSCAAAADVGACALRRAEAAALDVAHLRYDARGLVVTIRRSKTDQEGQGREIGVPFVANGRLCAATHVRKCDQGRFGSRHSACFRPSVGRDLARVRVLKPQSRSARGSVLGRVLASSDRSAGLGSRRSDRSLGRSRFQGTIIRRQPRGPLAADSYTARRALHTAERDEPGTVRGLGVACCHQHASRRRRSRRGREHPQRAGKD
jgi:hypothetical protein